uniref:Expressed protein n=2 Tax=Oryza TaxID=4527 RepID=H2KWA9_ORYSJ|nr:expressed protein [Oryza sativa Japonica Group]
MHPMLSDEEVTVTRCRLLKSPTSMIVIQQILDSPLHHSSFSSEAKKDNDPSKDIPSHLHLRRRINMDT